YQFYAQDARLRVEYQNAKGKKKTVTVRKAEGEDLGLEFETYLMDKQQHCKNKCVFCFIDQLPPGLRDTLYFKDDDARLSFLFGNYITLTNLTDADVDRIIEMHISPVNVSVHTMNPDLRVRMMKNPQAGESLRLLRRIADAGIALNTQLVLCPGLNDGDELVFSLKELEKLRPALRSVAAVPVGLTKYRERLPHLEEFTPETAKRVIETIDAFGARCKEKYGSRLAFAADEFYLKADLPLPDEDYYEDYPQLENGVGLWRSFDSEFRAALRDCDLPSDASFSAALATGVASFPLLRSFRALLESRFSNGRVDVYAIENDFFGPSITVAGLVTGRDLIAQLRGKDLHGRLLIPSVMLRAEGDVFLDDVSREDVERELGVRLIVVSNDGAALLDAIIAAR
ncbi:MAG: DUF512 domain-containing protein, partial [Clostridia bacterium]|nr:DUF512 domain-containing protein [Clostridia bacterium]